MIERAYAEGEASGVAVRTEEDEAGPYRTVPRPGEGREPAGEPRRRPHEHARRGTAKLSTLFHPATGGARARGVTRTTNAILRPWLGEGSAGIAEGSPGREAPSDPEESLAGWKSRQEGLSARIALPEEPPPLRMLLVRDSLV